MISPDDPEADLVADAATVLARGGLVAYPTDTLYGLGADPRNADAVARVYVAKGRGTGAALPLIAADLGQVESGAGACTAATRRLASRFWPGPLALVVDASPRLAAAVHGGSGTVAVRVPGHAVARALARALGSPVTATSANRSGHPAPADAAGVLAALGEDVDLVLDAGATRGGQPSTIVDARGERPRLVREGAIPFAHVLEALS